MEKQNNQINILEPQFTASKDLYIKNKKGQIISFENEQHRNEILDSLNNNNELEQKIKHLESIIDDLISIGDDVFNIAKSAKENIF